MLLLCGSTVILCGCASSQPRASSAPCQAVADAGTTYDPVTNITTISTNGYIWYIQGNATNMVITPAAGH